jgi:hypothetical protein
MCPLMQANQPHSVTERVDLNFLIRGLADAVALLRGYAFLHFPL